MSSVKKLHLVTSMIFIFFNITYTVEMSKVSSNNQGNLLSVRFCKIRKKLHLSNIQQWHRISICTPKGKTEAQQDRTSNPTALYQMHGASVSKGFSYISLSVLLFHICSYLSTAGILQLWYFNILWSQNASQALSSQLHAMDSHSIHTGFLSLLSIDACINAELKPQTKNP